MSDVEGGHGHIMAPFSLGKPRGRDVALAEALECPLLTADARLAGASGPACAITIVRR